MPMEVKKVIKTDFYRLNMLGEGILLTCQYDKDSSESNTFGPLPLDFFSN